MQDPNVRRAEHVARRRWQRARDRAADELFEKLVELRLSFHLQFGAGCYDNVIGLEDDVPIEPPTLRQVAEQAYDSLVDRDLELPEQRLADLVVRPLRLAAGLERPMRLLTAALEVLGPEAGEAATMKPHVGAHGCAPTSHRRNQGETP